MTQADMIANILAVYDASTEGQRARGHRWYGRMHKVARLHALRLGLEPHHVAGVFAAYSINARWGHTLRRAGRHLRGLPVTGLGMSIAKATACMAGEPLRVNDKSARKVLAFTANMAGDFQRVTVDRWAMRVAYGLTSGGYVPKGAEYDSIESAYQAAASLRDVTPAIMQAVTWVAARDGDA